MTQVNGMIALDQDHVFLVQYTPQKAREPGGLNAVNISSAIVHIVPERLDAACAVLAAMPGVEIHARSPEGKVVVTIEDDDTESATGCYVALHGVPGVASVAMVYQYSGEESDTEEVKA